MGIMTSRRHSPDPTPLKTLDSPEESRIAHHEVRDGGDAVAGAVVEGQGVGGRRRQRPRRQVQQHLLPLHQQNTRQMHTAVSLHNTDALLDRGARPFLHRP
jgi:hypothetical protein